LHRAMAAALARYDSSYTFDSFRFEGTENRGFGERFLDSAWQGDYASQDNGAAGIAGQTAVGLIPYVGQVADIRDWSAAANDLRREGLGWRTGVGITLATVAFVPLAGDLLKGGVKPLLRVADDVPPGSLMHPHAGGGGIPSSTIEPGSVVTYRPIIPGLENHHGVLDVWATHNVPGYSSRAAGNPAVALTREQHDATKDVYRDWLKERTGREVGGQVDWTTVSPREAQSLAERMFNAADVSKDARQEYYRAFNQYIYKQ
jgi:hypothetical protein